MSPEKTACLFPILLPVMVAALVGCGSVRSYRAADPYIVTHHTWWNYYQRGRLYLHDKNYAAARKDFESALGRIKGARYPYAQERWRARTYGMHMIEGYFPHRELGICLYYLNESSEALRLLETSMGMEPSARAKFYINQLHKQQAQAAIPAPEIKIEPFSTWTSQRTFLLQGTAFGSNRIARVSINGEPEFIELVHERLIFQREIPVTEGQNRFQIVAEDFAGKKTTANVMVMADWTPPQINLRREGNVLAINFQDNFELQECQINNQTESLTGKEDTLKQQIQPDLPLQLTVSDLAGNTASWTLSKNDMLHLAKNREPAPPRLDVNHAGATITQYTPEYELDIRAADDTALHKVELNGENLLTRTTPLFRALRRVPLSLGTNYVSVALEDNDGNRVDDRITVIYRKPSFLDSIYRLAAMLSPVSGEVDTPAFAHRIENIISGDLTTPPVRFYLIADAEDEPQLQKEQELSDSIFADPRAMLDQGRKLDTDLVFITRILSDSPGQTVYTQVLDAHNGDELFIEDVYIEDTAELPAQLEGLVMKIEQRFPLLQGRIQELNGRLAIDAGESKGTRKGLRMLVIRSAANFDQGRVVKYDNRPMEVVVSEVEPEKSMIIIPRGQPREAVRPGDYVFSR